MLEKAPNPILVEIYREGELESFHRGVVCVVDRKGKLLYSEGDIQQVCYPRSALKFFQQIPLLESGAVERFDFTTEELAIMCGSHNGEEDHVRVVQSILNKIGLGEDNLLCGPQPPVMKKDLIRMYKDDEEPRQITNNCSGKHAGFLAYCVHKGLDYTDYINPKHQLQEEVMRITAEMYEYPAIDMTIALDGCSAPIFSIPVYNQALAYKNLVATSRFDQNRQRACELLVNAVRKYPFMLAGNQRYCTEMMKICGHRVLGKTGAEGVFGMTLLREEIAVAIKIDDGKMQPQYNVAQAFIESTGLFSQEELKPLYHWKENDIKNYNRLRTGVIKVRDGLFSGINEIIKEYKY